MNFISLIKQPLLHARWLNTLSFLENCGARKIAAYEHPTLVKKEVLKHAAEEFRHALHFKRQIGRLNLPIPDDYRNILGGFYTRRYLDRLELQICRLLPDREHAYHHVTYAIEKRAERLYPEYEKALKIARCRVSVRSIILEEEGHLAEMEAHIPSSRIRKALCAIEHALYNEWMHSMYSQII